MSQSAKIREMYEAGIPQKDIALALDCSPNSVSRTICDYRKKTGRYISPAYTVAAAKPLDADIGDMGAFAMRNYRKSVAGARKQLEAMNAQ